jgi:5-methylcytosine-specific restriction protein A
MSDLPDPYSVVQRKPLTNRQMIHMFIYAKGVCELCGQKIDGIRDMWDEHMTPLWVGGSNEEWNRKPVHRRCGQAKTSKEATQRARIRSFAEFHYGAKRSRTPMPGGKRSAWKKKMDGSVVRRDEE